MMQHQNGVEGRSQGEAEPRDSDMVDVTRRSAYVLGVAKRLQHRRLSFDFADVRRGPERKNSKKTTIKGIDPRSHGMQTKLQYG